MVYYASEMLIKKWQRNHMGTAAGANYLSRLSIQIFSGNDTLCFKSGLADQILSGRVGLAKGCRNGSLAETIIQHLDDAAVDRIDGIQLSSWLQYCF